MQYLSAKCVEAPDVEDCGRPGQPCCLPWPPQDGNWDLLPASPCQVGGCCHKLHPLQFEDSL